MPQCHLLDIRPQPDPTDHGISGAQVRMGPRNKTLQSRRRGPLTYVPSFPPAHSSTQGHGDGGSLHVSVRLRPQNRRAVQAFSVLDREPPKMSNAICPTSKNHYHARRQHWSFRSLFSDRCHYTCAFVSLCRHMLLDINTRMEKRSSQRAGVADAMHHPIVSTSGILHLASSWPKADMIA